MSSWRFGDVQHSLSLSCDFILRLPLFGVCLRSQLLLFPPKSGCCRRVRLQVEQVSAPLECVRRNEKWSSGLINLACLQKLMTEGSQTLVCQTCFCFFGGYFTLQMHYSASWVTNLNRNWNWKQFKTASALCSSSLAGFRRSLAVVLQERKKQTQCSLTVFVHRWGSDMKTGRFKSCNPPSWEQIFWTWWNTQSGVLI